MAAKAFRFRLQTLLRIRQVRRDQVRAALARGHQATEKLNVEIEGLGQEIQDNRALHRQRPGEFDIDRLLQAERYELVLKSRQLQLMEDAQKLAVEVEKIRLVLVEADRDVRVLEKLRETQSQRAREELARQEMKALDEVAVMRFRPMDEEIWDGS